MNRIRDLLMIPARAMGTAGASLLMALAVLLGVVSGAQPAAADHAWAHGHWHSTVHPGVWNTYAPWKGVVDDGAYSWENATGKGYTQISNLDPACGWRYGWIVTCFPNRGTNLNAFAPGAGNLGDGMGGTLRDANGHVYAGITFVANDLSGAKLQRVMRHEFGHALGLGHTSEYSIMRSDAPTTAIGPHDLDAARWHARS